jgi:hypothetical protein
VNSLISALDTTLKFSEQRKSPELDQETQEEHTDDPGGKLVLSDYPINTVLSNSCVHFDVLRRFTLHNFCLKLSHRQPAYNLICTVYKSSTQLTYNNVGELCA